MKSVLFAGFPETGKSTYLAAFWHLLESGEVNCALSLQQLSGDREYLESLRDKWLELKEVERTPAHTTNEVRLELEDERSGEIFELSVPDISGEIYATQFKERGWTASFAQLARSVNGVVLFVHPNTVQEPKLITDVEKAVEALDNNGSENPTDDKCDRSRAGSQVNTPESTKDWEIGQCCTQVKLVDTIQFLAKEVGSKGRFRVAVVISAWDVVVKSPYSQTKPKTYVSERLPLLAQYLSASPDVSEYRIFGVSAQGGDLAADREELASVVRAADRVFLQTVGVERDGDITMPIRWLLDLDESQT